MRRTPSDDHGGPGHPLSESDTYWREKAAEGDARPAIAAAIVALATLILL